MPWVKDVPAILQAWFLGSEAGNSIADVLFGKVNPSGKLPMTFPRGPGRQQCPCHRQLSRREARRSDILDLEYKEGIMVGYRWHDTKKVKPLFAFGHGLSYTDFAYGDVKADCKEMTSDGSMTFRIPLQTKAQYPAQRPCSSISATPNAR